MAVASPRQVLTVPIRPVALCHNRGVIANVADLVCGVSPAPTRTTWH